MIPDAGYIILAAAMSSGLIICGCMYGTYRIGLKEGRAEGEETFARIGRLEELAIRLIRSTYTRNSASTGMIIKEIRCDFPRIDKEISKDHEKIDDDE